jgi:hypothetical protein
MTPPAPANYINHIAIVADQSSSMTRHAAALVKVADNATAHLAERSRAHDQETRVTFYTFSSRGRERCLFYDKDVLRMPSVAGLYRPDGMTALIDATLLAISDLRQTAQLYGEHAFLIYVLSDGIENNSSHGPRELSGAIAALPGNWTLAAFAPDQQAVFGLKGCGFPAGNVTVWDTTSTVGVEAVGDVIRASTETFMEGRKHGVHGYNRGTAGSLFQLRDFSASDVKAAAVALTDGSYFFLDVSNRERIDEFVIRETKKPYSLGGAYYQFTKTVAVQPHKQIAVEVTEAIGGREVRSVYSGPGARAILGLPGDSTVRVRPDQKPGCTIFIQSKSYNRVVLPGTRVLIMR